MRMTYVRHLENFHLKKKKKKIATTDNYVQKMLQHDKTPEIFFLQLK